MSTPLYATPNVVIHDPRARRIARTALDVVGVVLGTAIVADVATDAFDIMTYTGPAMAVWTYLRLAFGQGVDNPNTPSQPAAVMTRDGDVVAVPPADPQLPLT